MSDPELVLAHASLVEAIPFVVSALLLIGLLGGIVWRDRRRPDDDGAEAGSERE